MWPLWGVMTHMLRTTGLMRLEEPLWKLQLFFKTTIFPRLSTCTQKYWSHTHTISLLTQWHWSQSLNFLEVSEASACFLGRFTWLFRPPWKELCGSRNRELPYRVCYLSRNSANLLALAWILFYLKGWLFFFSEKEGPFAWAHAINVFVIFCHFLSTKKML